MENDFWKSPENLFTEADGVEPKTTLDPQEPKATPRKFNLGNDKDRNEYYQLLMIKALMDNPEAIVKPSKAKEDEQGGNILRDEEGNVAGIKRSVVRGVHATGKNQTDLLKALRKDAYNKYGIKE